MKHFFTIILGLIAIINFAACKKERLSANGDIIAESRELAQFTGISASGATPIKITYGNEFKVLVKGSSNLVPHFNTRVVNQVLHLGFDHVNVHRDDIEVELTMPNIRRIDLSGTSEVDIKGNFPAQQRLSINVSGSGDVEVDDFFPVALVDVKISGSGEVDLKAVEAKRAEANISGSGSVKLHIVDHLKAQISGSGKVYYKGSPSIQQDISGSGKIIKL